MQGGCSTLREVEPVPGYLRREDRGVRPCEDLQVIAIIRQGATVVEVDGSNPSRGTSVAPLSVRVDDLPGLDAPRVVIAFDQADDVLPTILFAHGLASGFNQLALLSVLRRRRPRGTRVRTTGAQERGCGEEGHAG